MKKTIELDETDIKSILAEKFNCEPHHVTIKPDTVLVCNGSFQERINTYKAIIKQEASVC